MIPMIILAGIAVYMSFPAFILPVIIGPIIWIKFRADETSRAAAALTVKPLVATFLLGGSIPYIHSPTVNCTFLPGLLLTLAIVFKFRRLFRSSPSVFALLLAVDTVRWLNTFVMFSPWLGEPLDYENPGGPLYSLALFLPNGFAVMALVVAILRARWSKGRALPH